MRRPLLLLVAMYQNFFSPLLPASCRFIPSCSEYARQALEQHTLCKACALILLRLLRCHPFCTGGYDPVPVPNHLKERP